MSKNLSNKQIPYKSTYVLAIAAAPKCLKTVCKAAEAIELLDELRKSYRGLASEQRKRVKAFIRELSYAANS